MSQVAQVTEELVMPHTHVLQRVAVCVCSLFHCIAVRCSVSLNSQRNSSFPTHVCCSVLQYVAACATVCCSVLQCVVVCCSVSQVTADRVMLETRTNHFIDMHLDSQIPSLFQVNALQHTAAQWSTMVHTAATLHQTAAHYTTQQHFNDRIPSVFHSNTQQHAALHCNTLQPP